MCACDTLVCMGVMGMVGCMGDIVGNWGFGFVFGFGAGFVDSAWRESPCLFWLGAGI